MRQWLQQWFLNLSEPPQSLGGLVRPLMAASLPTVFLIQQLRVGPEDLHF